MLKRVKRRYVALRIDCSARIGSKDLTDAVWEAVSKLYGEYGACQAILSLVDFDEEQGIAVLRTGHTTLDMVRTAIASITRIRGKPAAVHVLTVSGTMKALRKSLKQRCSKGLSQPLQ